MRTLIIGACALLLAAAAAAQTASKPKFHGKWVLDPQKSELKALKLSASTLIIEQEKLPELAFKQSCRLADAAAERVVEFKCTTTGKECEYKVDSQPATMSMFYNGAMLVGYETINGSTKTVNRYHLSLSEDGGTLTLEISQLEPVRPEKDKLVYVKQ